MPLLRNDRETVTLQLTREEAAVLNNALNESLESLDAWEFEIRMGMSKDAVTRLSEAFGRLPL